jgi:adenylate kinase
MIFHRFHHLAAADSLSKPNSAWFAHRGPATFSESRKGVGMSISCTCGTAPREYQDSSATASSLAAVIGPPGAGKTTVVTALAQLRGLPVFRLREAVIAHSDRLADLAPSADPLGWVSVQAVDRILRAAFIDSRLGTCISPVLLDNFPGTAEQLHQLAEVASMIDRRITILELRADVLTLAVRVAARRICLACNLDRHAPATASVTDPICCAQCGAPLTRRDSDTPPRHALRLSRYRANVVGIIEHAGHLQIPHLAIRAGHPTPVVHRLAQEAFVRLTDPVRPLSRTTRGADYGHCSPHAHSSA